jgi:MFS family permease
VRAITPRVAITAVFLLNGVGFGAWAARIPAVQDRLDLSEGTLAVVLAAVAAGALTGMPIAGRAIARFGSRGLTRGALAGVLLVVAVIASSPSFPVLVAIAFLYGAGNGVVDVAMNAHGLLVERRAGKPILSSMHAAWSIGGLIGAGSAAATAAASVDARVHLLAVGLAAFAIGLWFSAHLLPGGDDAHPPDAPEALPGRLPAGTRRRLTILGAVAFCGLLAEGAAADWSAVYVNDSLGASEATAALVLTTYTLAMTVARLVGDPLTTAFGPVAVVRVSTLIAAGGLAFALIGGHPAAAFAGFACLGFGLAPVIPIVFRAAGAVPGIAAGRGIARTSATGYLGFLAGPPIIGGIAELTSLPVALGAVVASVSLCAALSGAVRASANPVPQPAPAPA